MIRMNKSVMIAYLLAVLGGLCFGQTDSNTNKISEAHTIILSPGSTKPVPFLYPASAKGVVRVGAKTIEQMIQLSLRIVQGETSQSETVSLGLGGVGSVVDVQGEAIASWAVRTVGSQRFLDIQLKPTNADKKDGETDNALLGTIRIRSEHKDLPTTLELAHLMPGKSLGFDSQIQIEYGEGVIGKVVSAEGFAPLISTGRSDRLQTATGGRLELHLDRNSALPPAIELLNSSLVGERHANGKSARFELTGTAKVNVPGSRLRALSGPVAFSQLPESSDYRLELVDSERGPSYELVFEKTGSFPVTLIFIAPVQADVANGQAMDFTVAASAIVPFALKGFDSEIDFAREPQTVIPLFVDKEWRGFLPATGRVNLRWQSSQKTGEGKSFFTTNATIETSVGPGLLRQDHRIAYQLLQGQLKSLSLTMSGPGEILNVEGERIVAWKVSGEGSDRILEITLNEPLTANSELTIRSQTPLGAFPLRVDGLRLEPEGAIRNSGHLRITNSGAVRVEPTNLRGLTQLAPEQFPGSPVQSRQLFAYRFPSSDYSFTVAADRVQPEVNVTQLVLYELSESDRAITVDCELDIREASIRDWTVSIPADYAVVSVSGASVTDYIVAAEGTNTQRSLKILFAQEVLGRQLVKLRLEKNEAAASGVWTLPRIEFPDSKSMRGDIGVVIAPGFRATVGTVEFLTEKPLSYFPQPVRNLQHAFRIREPNWSATIQIEKLEHSIQSDVFHLYSLSQGTVYGSALINYLVTGAPVAEWQLTVPSALANVTVDGQDIRTWRREGDTLFVSLQQPILGAYTLLVTFEEKPNAADGSFQAGQVAPLGVQGDRGYIEVVSPVQVEMDSLLVSSQLLVLDSLELPAEFRLLSTAPALGTWQYTQRPFDLRLRVKWFDPGSTTAQVVEFTEANSRVSPDGELVTDLLYYVKSRGQRTLKLQLPGEPVRLWEVAVNGRPVTARQAGDATLIPLPGGADPNVPIEVSLRLGKPALEKGSALLALPTVFAPVLKTQWNVRANEQHVLIPRGGSVEPTVPVAWPNGFDWLADQGLIPFVVLAVLLSTCAFVHLKPLRLIALCIAVIVAGFAFWEAFSQIQPLAPLDLNLPVLASGESVDLEVANLPAWRAYLSVPGLVIGVLGIVVLLMSCRSPDSRTRGIVQWISYGLIAVGVLMQPNGAPWFFGLVAIAVLGFQLLPSLVSWRKSVLATPELERQPSEGNPTGVVVSSVVSLLFGSLFLFSPICSFAGEESEAPTIRSASSLTQKWSISTREKRLKASAEFTCSGRPGDRFVLLHAPAVLTQFEGGELRLDKLEIPNKGIAYVVTIPEEANKDAATDDEANKEPSPLASYRATFQFQLEAIQVSTGVPVLTGNAALQKIELSYDEPNWEVVCESAARIDTETDPDAKLARVILYLGASPAASEMRPYNGPAASEMRPYNGPAKVVLRPQSRDVSREETHFFVEGTGLFTPSPGVVDGKHRWKIRTSQGRIQQLRVMIPQGLTVSTVEGPVSSWQFDADESQLKLQIAPSTPPEFSFTVETQRSLAAFPTEIELAPLRVEKADEEVGLIAIAFGSEAQPESVQSDSLSLVNLSDFDASILGNSQTTLHRVYRYGKEKGSLRVQVSPVAPEVKVISKQVISFGDERVIHGINFVTEITRTGLFQLSFPLPKGLEVESLTGESLHHWAEQTENDQRQIILHLRGKTIGVQKFSLTLAGTAPIESDEWQIPRFELNESARQSGDLVIQPMTGIRLRPLTRQNVSEADPRALGAKGQGALAFRLLQRNWSLRLGIEKLSPWVIGSVLHDVTLREGQTRTTLLADFVIQNAAIRTLSIRMPTMGADEIKTIRASGETVSDFVRSSQDERVWELRFKRRMIGPVQFQVEFERRGERTGNRESLIPVEFPEAKQISTYFALRAGGRLEIEAGTMTQGWQLCDWSTVPNSLREGGNRNAPALAIRAMSPSTPLSLRVIRHSLADALRLRVASGTLTTILSPTK
jgi:hypothetical protein